MGIDFNDADGIKPELLEQAKSGEAMMKKTVSTDGAATTLSNRGGGSGNDKSLDEVLRDSENNLIKVRQIISQGGFTGPEKDNYELSLAHAEWVHARNIDRKCDNDVKETSVKYTALVKGHAQDHEINKSHKDWKTTRETCNKSSSELLEKANKYIEVDRRVRQNRKAAEEYPVTFSTTRERFQVKRDAEEDTNVEGFTGTNPLKEGFDFYNGNNYQDGNFDASKGNARLPLYDDSNRNTQENKSTTILPWSDYYIDCEEAYKTDVTAKNRCINANKEKDKYIKTINHEFDRSDRLLNIYYNIALKSAYRGNQNYLSPEDTKALLENQKRSIDLHKQNALYDYDEYNSLSFYEDLVIFLYYAVFTIFVLMSLRDFFSSGGSYDKRNIIIVILLGIYPKYILSVVLWIFDGITNIAELLGLKNVRFWNSTE
jgi:hypothetical protein